MFVLLENQKDIARAQRLLERVVHREFGNRTVRDIGFPRRYSFTVQRCEHPVVTGFIHTMTAPQRSREK